MPIPKYNKVTQEDFEAFYNRNRKWFDKNGWSKDVAQNAFVARNLRKQGANYDENVNTYDKATLKQLYSEGFEGPNPYDRLDTNFKQAQPDSVYQAYGLEPPKQNQPQTKPQTPTTPSQGLGFKYSDTIPTYQGTSVPQKEKELEEGKYKIIRQTRRSMITDISDNALEEARGQEIKDLEQEFTMHPSALESTKNEITKKLESDKNTWYSNNIEYFNQNFNDTSIDWWRNTAAKYTILKSEKGQDYADDYIRNAVIKRVNEEQTFGQSMARLFPAMGKMFISQSAITLGATYGLLQGAKNVFTNAHKGVGVLGELGAGIIENPLVGWGADVLEQGTLSPTEDFDPSTQQPGAYISPNRILAQSASQVAFSYASMATGGLEMKAAKMVGKGVGALTHKAARRAASDVTTRLAGETAEEFAKRMADIKARKELRDKVAFGLLSLQGNVGEATADARDNYNQILEYGERAIKQTAQQEANNRLAEELGTSNFDEYIDQKARERIQWIVDNNPDIRIDYKQEYEKIAKELRSSLDFQRELYRQQAERKHDNDYTNNLAVAIKAANNTLLTETAVLAVAELVGDKAFRWEGMKNLRRQANMPNANRFSGQDMRGVTWNGTKNRAEALTTSRKQNIGNATKKWLMDATLTEVIPEEIQSFVSAYNDAIGTNAIDQYIKARTNAEVGDLYYGEGGMKTGIKAGWKTMKEQGGTVALQTYLSMLMPNVSTVNPRQIINRPENVSVAEHISNILGNQLTRNYFEQVNANKHAQFYADEINKLLDESPYLQNIVAQGMTMENFQSISDKALNAGDMAHFQQSELGQLVSLMMDIQASGMENAESPLNKINAQIDRVLNATIDSEEGQAIVQEARQSGNNQVKHKLRKNQDYRKSDEQIFNEVKKSAERMDRIRKGIQTATDLVTENFSTYDEDIQNALIFGKAFNEAFRKDVQEEKQEAQNIISSYKSNSQPSEQKEGTATIEEIEKIATRERINKKRYSADSLQDTIETLVDLQERYENADEQEKEMIIAEITNTGNKYGVKLSPKNISSFASQLQNRRTTLLKEIRSDERKFKDILKDKDIVFTAEDLVNADVETRRWLLNRENWSSLSDSSKRQLSSLINELNALNPAFENTARHAANLESIMKENEDALTAYISDPNKLTPIYNRVMRERREQKFQSEIDELRNAPTYEDFVDKYRIATSLDLSAFGRNVQSTKGRRYQLEHIEKIAYINKKLQGNKYFERYNKEQRKQKAMKKASDNASSVSTATTQSDKDIREARRERDEIAIDYLASLNIDMNDINAIEEAMLRSIDGQPLGTRLYFENSAYGQFVKEQVEKKKKEGNIFERMKASDFAYATPNEALQFFNNTRKSAESLLPDEDKQKQVERPKTSSPIDNVPFDPNDLIPSYWSNPDSDEFNAPYSENDDAETLAKKMAYHFQFNAKELEPLIIIFKEYWFEAFNNNASLSKEELENIKKENIEVLNKVFEILHSYEIDMDQNHLYNFNMALHKAINSILKDGNVPYIIKTIRNAYKNNKSFNSPVFQEQSERQEDLRQNSVESINTYYTGENKTLTLEQQKRNERRRILQNFAKKLNVHAFLNSNPSNILTIRKPKFNILSGDFKFEDGTSINDELRATYDSKDNEVFDAQKNGALIVVYELTTNQAQGWKKRDDVKVIYAKKYRNGKVVTVPFQVVGFLPSASPNFENNPNLIDKWRKEISWKNDNEAQEFVADKTLYLHKNGFKFSFVNKDKTKFRPINEVTAIAKNFSDLFSHITEKKVDRPDEDGGAFFLPAVRATDKDSPFSVFEGRQKTNDTITIYVAPMQNSFSISEKKYHDKKTNNPQAEYAGESIEEILNDTENGVDKLREMHHTTREGGKTKSWGRMGRYFYLMRQAFIGMNFDDINTFIGSVKDEDSPQLAHSFIFSLPKDYKISCKPNSDGSYRIDLQKGDHFEKKLGDIPASLIQELSDFGNNQLANATSEDFNKIISLDNKSGVGKELLDKIDALSFEIMKNLMLNDRGKIRTPENKPNDSFVKWNLFYGAIPKSTNPIATTGINVDNENNINATYKIYEDFYDAGLLTINDNLETLFFTDKEDKAYSTYRPAMEQTIPTKNEKGSGKTILNFFNKELPRVIKNIIELAKLNAQNRQLNRSSASITSITNILDGAKDDFDPESPWGSVSSGVGNIIDGFARDLFADKIFYDAKANKYYFKSGEDGTELNAKYPNISPEDLQRLAEELCNIKDMWRNEGYDFISNELVLNGEIDLVGENGKHVKYPINGRPDIIAYNAETGKIRIIDVKNKHTSDPQGNPTFWSYNEDAGRDMNSDAGKAITQYTAQVSLYKQCLEDMTRFSDGPNAEVESLYLLEIPTLYAKPEPNKRVYSVSNGVVMVKEGNKDAVPAVIKIGKVGKDTLHERKPVQLDNRVDVHDRYRYLARKLARQSFELARLNSSYDKLKSNNVKNAKLDKAIEDVLNEIKKVKSSIAFYEAGISHLTYVWSRAYPDDNIAEESGNIETNLGKATINGIPLNTATITPEAIRQNLMENNKIAVINMLTGSDIIDFISDENMLAHLGAKTTSKIMFGTHLEGGKNFVIGANDEIIINEEWLDKMLEKYGFCDPFTCIDNLINCHLA